MPAFRRLRDLNDHFFAFIPVFDYWQSDSLSVLVKQVNPYFPDFR